MPDLVRYNCGLLSCFARACEETRTWKAGDIPRLEQPVRVLFFKAVDGIKSDIQGAHTALVIPPHGDWPLRYISFVHHKDVNAAVQAGTNCMSFHVYTGNSLRSAFSDPLVEEVDQYGVDYETVNFHDKFYGQAEQAYDLHSLDVRAMHIKLDGLLGAQRQIGVKEVRLRPDPNEMVLSRLPKVKIQLLSRVDINDLDWNFFGYTCSPKDQNCASICYMLLKAGKVHRLSSYGKFRTSLTLMGYSAASFAASTLLFYLGDLAARGNDEPFDSPVEQYGTFVGWAGFSGLVAMGFITDCFPHSWSGVQFVTRSTGLKILTEKAVDAEQDKLTGQEPAHIPTAVSSSTALLSTP